MDRPRRTIHIDHKTESLCRKTLSLKGLEELLKPGETVNTKHNQQQLIDLNRSLPEKRLEYRKREHKVILFMTMLHHMWQTRFTTRW